MTAIFTTAETELNTQLTGLQEQLIALADLLRGQHERLTQQAALITDLVAQVASQGAEIAALKAGTVPPPPVVPPVEPPPVVVPPPDPEPEPAPVEIKGVWLSPDELAALPMTGPEWGALKQAADAAKDAPAIVADQDNNQDVAIMAVALVAARTGAQAYRDKALSMLYKTAELKWRDDSRMNMLEWGRNFTALYIAADLLGMRQGPIYDFLKDALAGCKDQHHGGNVMSAEDFAWFSGSNSYSQVAAGAVAGAIYTGDKAMLDRLWTKFQRFAGDRTSPHKITINEWNTFETDESNPVGIQPKGATKDGCNVDGAIGNDIGRENGTPCRPVWTFYGATGFEGWGVAAYLLSRAGYPAFEVQDKAVLRAYQYWQYLAKTTGDARWDDPNRAEEVRQLIKRAYKLDIPVQTPIKGGRTIGFTGWTHPS